MVEIIINETKGHCWKKTLFKGLKIFGFGIGVGLVQQLFNILSQISIPVENTIQISILIAILEMLRNILKQKYKIIEKK